LIVAFLVAGMLHPGLIENDKHRLVKQSVVCLALHGLPVCEACLSCFRGVEDESITLPKGKRDYLCLVDNMLIIAGEDKPSKGQMAEADNDLIKKHVGSNRAMYGRLQYILLFGTAGPDLKLNAMSITPGSVLQELFPAMEVRGCRPATRTWKDLMFACLNTSWSRMAIEKYKAMHTMVLLSYCAAFHFNITELQVTSPTNRQKALLMFINVVRWVRTVHEQHVLPVHRHQLFRNMPRPSPYPGECRSSCNVPCRGAAALHSRPHLFWMSA